MTWYVLGSEIDFVPKIGFDILNSAISFCVCS